MALALALHAIAWTEYESGWGCRPDGISVHRSEADANAFVAQQYAKMPTGYVPNEYSTAGNVFLVEVSQELFDAIQSRINIWTAINNPHGLKDWKP